MEEKIKNFDLKTRKPKKFRIFWYFLIKFFLDFLRNLGIKSYSHRKRNVKSMRELQSEKVPEFVLLLPYAYYVVKLAQENYQKNLYTTAIHKLVYLTLAKFNEKLLSKTYEPHYYGPYSEDLNQALIILTGRNYINAKRKGLIGTIYSITDKPVRKEFEKEKKEVEEIIKKVVDLTDEKENILDNIQKLADLTKVHYLYRFHGLKVPEKIVKKARFLGWSLNEENVNKCLEYLRRASFIS